MPDPVAIKLKYATVTLNAEGDPNVHAALHAEEEVSGDPAEIGCGYDNTSDAAVEWEACAIGDGYTFGL